MKLFLVLFFSSALFACKGPEEVQTPVLVEIEETVDSDTTGMSLEEIMEKSPISTQLVGTWNWVKTNCCSRMPKITTPEDVGFNKTLIFTESGNATLYKGNKIEWEKPYKLGFELMDSGRPTIRFGEHQLALIYYIGDTLVIDYGYMDLQTDYYLPAGK